jgi:hypothetical protein
VHDDLRRKTKLDHENNAQGRDRRKELKRILIVSVAVVVALLSALPALAMIANEYKLTSAAGRSLDKSFGTPGKAEYCEKSGSPDCDDDDDDKDKKDKDKKDKDKKDKDKKDRDDNDGRNKDRD